MTFDASYYEDLRGRLHAALFEVAASLSDPAWRFVMEEVDANELGLALEVLVDELEQQQVALRAPLVADLSALEGTMGISIDVVGRLTPLIVEGS